MISDSAKTSISVCWIVPIWIGIGLAWAISDQSPVSALKAQIQVMNEAYSQGE
jgi:hypothetical protein